MSGSIELWDWERAIFRQLLYSAPDGSSRPMSIIEAANAAGHRDIHPDKLRGLANKMVAVGYGQATIREITVPSIDIDFRLSAAGREAALLSTQELRYVAPLERIAKFSWSTLAAIVAAIAAIASAVIAYRASS